MPRNVPSRFQNRINRNARTGRPWAICHRRRYSSAALSAAGNASIHRAGKRLFARRPQPTMLPVKAGSSTGVTKRVSPLSRVNSWIDAPEIIRCKKLRPKANATVERTNPTQKPPVHCKLIIPTRPTPARTSEWATMPRTQRRRNSSGCGCRVGISTKPPTKSNTAWIDTIASPIPTASPSGKLLDPPSGLPANHPRPATALSTQNPTLVMPKLSRRRAKADCSEVIGVLPPPGFHGKIAAAQARKPTDRASDQRSGTIHPPPC